MTDLGQFLQEHLAEPRKAGEWDCCGMPAAWAMANGCDDPMAAWRGVYSTDAEADEIVARSGGLAGIFGTGLEGVGMQPVPLGDPLLPGDVGVINIIGEEAGAIYTGVRWAFVAVKGLGFIVPRPSAITHVWRLPAHG